MSYNAQDRWVTLCWEIEEKLRCYTPVFGCWFMNHVIYFKLRKNNCCYKLSKLTFFSQKCQVWKKQWFWVELVNYWICLAFNWSYFCLILRLTTWCMNQQSETNTDIEHLREASFRWKAEKLFFSFFCSSGKDFRNLRRTKVLIAAEFGSRKLVNCLGKMQ